MSEPDIKAIRVLLETMSQHIANIAVDLNEVKQTYMSQQFKPASQIEKPQPKQEESKPQPPTATKPAEPKPSNKLNIIEIGDWCDVEGVMKDDPTLKKGTKQDGSEWKLAYFRLDLPQTTVKVTLWDKLAGEIMQYTAGEHIILNGLMAKAPYKDGGNVELSNGNYTKITVL